MQVAVKLYRRTYFLECLQTSAKNMLFFIIIMINKTRPEVIRSGLETNSLWYDYLSILRKSLIILDLSNLSDLGAA